MIIDAQRAARSFSRVDIVRRLQQTHPALFARITPQVIGRYIEVSPSVTMIDS
jgi:hypothetical protein